MRLILRIVGLIFRKGLKFYQSRWENALPTRPLPKNISLVNKVPNKDHSLGTQGNFSQLDKSEIAIIHHANNEELSAIFRREPQPGSHLVESIHTDNLNTEPPGKPSTISISSIKESPSYSSVYKSAVVQTNSICSWNTEWDDGEAVDPSIFASPFFEVPRAEIAKRAAQINKSANNFNSSPAK